ncbi:MAG: transcriptional repressor LexA [Ruminococcaceae bacterium]|nr:transcriptional repressor LexA [Oscillospiraceae bacterium]
MTTLDQKEQLIFDYIKENIRKNGYSPSIRDIRTALGIKSTSTVHTYLERLERKGYIQKENGKSRTLRIEGLMPEDYNPDENSGMVPLIGRVTAGQPILAVENYEGYIQYPAGLYRKPENDLFALRVSGTSMIEAGIHDGDIVIIEKTSTAENGDIVVALIDDEATVKTFYKEDGHFRLQPENKTMLPIIVNSLMILGKVVASVRFYR